jgi:putative transposase
VEGRAPAGFAGNCGGTRSCASGNLRRLLSLWKRRDMTDLPRRRTPAHHPVIARLGAPTIVFLTVCTDKHKALLCDEAVHIHLRQVWNDARTWLVGRYVLMSDHIHLFCSPAGGDAAVLLDKWVQYWKSQAVKRWPGQCDKPIWQKSFWDTKLRSNERYGEKWDYVCQNPVRKGLVARAEDWPYQGELNRLAWYD